MPFNSITNCLLTMHESYTINDQVGAHVVARFKKLRLDIIKTYSNKKNCKSDFLSSFVTPWDSLAAAKHKLKGKAKAIEVVSSEEEAEEGKAPSTGKGKGKAKPELGDSSSKSKYGGDKGTKCNTWKIVSILLSFSVFSSDALPF